MFFGKIVSYTCDLHLKQNILKPLNISFGQIVEKISVLPCNYFFQIFKTLKFLYDLVSHQVHTMNVYFHRRGACFCCTKSLKSII
jgi:hypothetical protein